MSSDTKPKKNKAKKREARSDSRRVTVLDRAVLELVAAIGLALALVISAMQRNCVGIDTTAAALGYLITLRIFTELRVR